MAGKMKFIYIDILGAIVSGLFAILLMASVCTADLYYWVDENGLKHYSNQEPGKNKHSTQLPESKESDKIEKSFKREMHDKISMSSPENTLKGYFRCLETADNKCALKRFHEISSFKINVGVKVEYKILKKRIFNKYEVEEWNSKFVPMTPKTKIGDVELYIVERYVIPGFHRGYKSYLFRKINGNWYIIGSLFHEG